VSLRFERELPPLGGGGEGGGFEEEAGAAAAAAAATTTAGCAGVDGNVAEGEEAVFAGSHLKLFHDVHVFLDEVHFGHHLKREGGREGGVR